MQKIIKLTIILLLFFILGIFFIALNQTSNYNTQHLVGNKVKDIQLDSFQNNKIIYSEDLKDNNFTLINFWASWCAPCRVEHPFLMELSQEKNLKILGVNFKDKRNNALNFLDNLGNPYHYLAKDDQGKQSIGFGIYGIPESILIDKDFIVIKKFVGPLNLEDLNEIKKITNLL